MKPYEERKARERQAHGQTAPGKTLSADGRTAIESAGRVSQKLAEKVNVGRRTMERAIKVREQGTEELNAAVAAGASLPGNGVVRRRIAHACDRRLFGIGEHLFEHRPLADAVMPRESPEGCCRAGAHHEVETRIGSVAEPALPECALPLCCCHAHVRLSIRYRVTDRLPALPGNGKGRGLWGGIE